jgi:hypothetical protein
MSQTKAQLIDNLVQALSFTGTSSAPANGVYLSATNQLSFATNTTERLRIDSAGQLEAVSLGSASAPTYSWTTDPDTGVYSPGANQVAISTNGTGRLFVDANGRVGVGIASPQTSLHVFAGTSAAAYATFSGNNGSPDPFLIGQDTTGLTRLFQTAAQPITFWTNSVERMRLDSSGRLLVGTSTARSNFFGTTLSSLTQTEGTGGSTARGALSVINNAVSNDPPYVLLGRSGAATLGSNAAVVSGSRLGTLTFHGADGTSFIEAATVAGEVDGTPGTNDMPGRLVFSTTADGAASPTERLRIDSSGRVGLGTSTVSSILHINAGAAADTNVRLQAGAAGNHAKHTYSDSTNTVQWTSGYRSSTNTFGINVGDSFNSTGITIDSSGRVGIGTQTPSWIFDVKTATGYIGFNTSGGLGSQIRFANSSNVNTAAISNNGGSNELLQFDINNNAGAGQIVFNTVGSERARIDSSGRLLVGTSSAYGNNYLQVQGDAAAGTGTGAISLRRGAALGAMGSGSALGLVEFAFVDGGVGAQIAGVADGAAGTNDYPGRLVFSTTADGASSPTERLRIRSDGVLVSPVTYAATSATSANVNVDSSGNFTRSTSSAKYKADIESIDDSYSDALLNCRPVWYRSTSNNDNPSWSWWGFIAEEVAEIDPRLVQWKTVEVTYDDNGSAIQTPCDPEPEGVAYDRFVPHLLNLIKRQKEQIEAMEARLSALESA